MSPSFDKNDINLIFTKFKNNENDNVEKHSELTLQMVAAKMLINRWNKNVTYCLFNLSQKEYVINLLKHNPYYNDYNEKYVNIWNIKLIFTDHCPNNTGILLSMFSDSAVDDLTGKDIAIFNYE